MQDKGMKVDTGLTGETLSVNCPICTASMHHCIKAETDTNEYWLCPNCRHYYKAIGRERKSKPDDKNHNP